VPPVGRLLVTVMSGVNEFERGLIRSRCEEGIERAKIVTVTDTDGYFEATVRTAKYALETTPNTETAMQRVTENLHARYGGPV